MVQLTMITVDMVMDFFLTYGFVYAVYATPLLIVGTVMMSFLVPKHIVKKYFRAPHFHDGDDELFKHFPFRYHLTLAIAQLTAVEFFANRRKAFDLRKDSPLYWVILSKFYFWFIVVLPILAFLSSVIGLGYFELTGRPVPN